MATLGLKWIHSNGTTNYPWTGSTAQNLRCLTCYWNCRCWKCSRRKSTWAPVQLFQPGASCFPSLLPHQAHGPCIDKCVLPVWFPGSLYWLHIKPNVHFAINIARGLRDARQPLFNQCFCFTTCHAWWYWKEKPIKGKINLVIKQNTLDCWLLTLAPSHLLRGQNRTCLLSSATKGFLVNKGVLLWMIKMSSLANGPGQSSITALFNPNLKMTLLSSRMT